MPEIKATKSDRTYLVDDGQKRGPMTTSRVRFHPAARFLFAQVVDRRLALWNLDAAPQKGKKGEAVMGSLVCPHEAGWVRGFDVHPRGEAVATGGSDRRLRLWKWEGDKPGDMPAFDVAGHDGWVEAVAFSPDGQTLATVGADRKIKLWDAAKGTLLLAAAAHTNYPRDVVFTPDGKHVVSGGEDGVALVWDAATLKGARTIDTGMTSEQQGQDPAKGGIIRLSLSHDGRWLALAGDRQTLVYEFATGRGVGALAQAGSDAMFGRKLNLLAVGDNTLRLLSLESEKFSPKVVEVKVDARGKKLAASWPALPHREVVAIKRGDFSCGTAFAADDRLLAAGKTDGTVELWTIS